MCPYLMHNCMILFWTNDSLVPGTRTVNEAVPGVGLGAGTGKPSQICQT